MCFDSNYQNSVSNFLTIVFVKNENCLSAERTSSNCFQTCSFRTDDTEMPIAVVLHNGVQTENKEARSDSENLTSTSSTLVTKVQNGGVAGLSKGGCMSYM